MYTPSDLQNPDLLEHAIVQILTLGSNPSVISAEEGITRREFEMDYLEYNLHLEELYKNGERIRLTSLGDVFTTPSLNMILQQVRLGEREAVPYRSSQEIVHYRSGQEKVPSFDVLVDVAMLHATIWNKLYGNKDLQQRSSWLD